MSRIDQMQILGIRSFENAESETIVFQTPLTLIVGTNGSGKTTIIECLKYATTGELPPNSRGGAFIHDPKLCGEKEVKAQVKLGFRSATADRLVATRSLQLTVKKTARQQKTLDCNLRITKANGEKKSVSTRVAEMDVLIPQYLGVSKAVLDSVVFCHQDESLWPLSEPSVLKKKFDEIFEALKYTKAIENIKQMRKKQGEELAKFRIIQQHSKEDKDKADKAEKRSGELADEIEILRGQTKALHEKAQTARDKAQDAWNHVARFSEVVESLKAARKSREWYQKQVHDLRQDLKERPEDDAWLESELSNYDDRMKAHQSRQDEMASRYEVVKGEIGQTRGAQSNERIEAGRYEQQKATHEQRVRDRASEITKSAREHNIRGFDSDLDDMQISEFMERITKLSKDQTSRVDRLRRENAAEVQKVQDVLVELRERRSALQESRKVAREQETSFERRAATLHTDVDKVSVNEGQKAALEGHVVDLQSRLRQAEEAVQKGDVDKRIQETEKELTSLDHDSAAASRALREGTKRAEDLASLNHLKKEAKDRQRSLETMKGAHGPRLEDFLGSQWDLDSLEQAFNNLLDGRKRDVADAQRQRDGVDRQLEQIEFKLKTARNDVAKRETELSDCLQSFRTDHDIAPDEYPETLSTAQENRDIRNSDVEAFGNMRQYFLSSIKAAQGAEPVCRLCQRPFEKEKDATAFISRMEKHLTTATLNAMQEELQGFERELANLKKSGSKYDLWVRLSNMELPSLRGDIAKLEEERSKTIREAEQHDRAVKEMEEALRDAETLSKPVAAMLQCRQEITSFNAQIQQLSSDADEASASTIDEIHERLETINNRARELRQKIERLRGEHQEQRELVSSLGVELGTARTKVADAKHELDKKTTLFAQITDCKAGMKKQQEMIAGIDGQLQELSPRFAEEQTRLDDLRERGEGKEKSLQKEAMALADSVRSLMRADEEIRSYIEQGGPTRLAQAQRNVQSYEQTIVSLEAELKQVTIEINKVREELGGQEQRRRDISDNLKYRRTLRELDQLEEQIEGLVGQNAEADQDHYRAEAEKWQRVHNLAATEETSKMGTMKAKDDQLVQLLKDWETDYKDAAAKYRKAHIEVETTKAAVEDLGRYGGALDKAIMKYHSIKMEEINRSLEELWKRTYQGTDVDTILIRSDHETAKGNRSYNYRVCMVKQDAEMDMRGRCSAGQKVLASILIRLALAECFGVECGLIALDEPTTNLDRENIRALAASLHDIIHARRQQRNFQLIVITHDEEFLREMQCGDFADYYWRISRNAQQTSIIERQDIRGVF